MEIRASPRTRAGLTPSALACSSPSARALSVSPEASASSSPTARNGQSQVSRLASRSSREPTTQKR